DPVSAVVAGCGRLLAAWYTRSAAGGTLCAGARLLGSTWHAGERLLRRRGAPGVARLLGAGSGAVLAASLALVPAQAATPPAPDARQPRTSAGVPTRTPLPTHLPQCNNPPPPRRNNPPARRGRNAPGPNHRSTP